jgi:hypothetical protein
MRASPLQQLEQLAVADQAILTQDRLKLFNSDQALIDTYHYKMMGVPLPAPEDSVIHFGDVNTTTTQASPQPATPPAAPSALSPLAAVALGLLGAAVPAAGVIGYLLNTAKPVATAVQAAEKAIPPPAGPVAPIVQKYNVGVDMQVIPPN